MAMLAYIVAMIAAAGAFAAWIAAAIFFFRARSELPAGNRMFAMVAWPFAVSRMQGPARSHASKVHLAMAAFFGFLLLAIAAGGGAAQLARAGL